MLLDLEEGVLVHDGDDGRLHVVGLVRIFRDQRLQHPVPPLRVIARRDRGRTLPVAPREVGKQVSDAGEGVGLRVVEEVGDATLDVVDFRATELVEAHLLAGRHPDHFGAGDEHVAEVLDHEDEIRDRRRVDGAAGARAGDHRELGDDAGRLDVAVEDVGIAGEADDSLLDAGAAGVVDPDARPAGTDREIHHLADLLRKHLPQ